MRKSGVSRWSATMAMLALAAYAPAVGASSCHLTKYLELPVFLTNQRALVSTKISGKDARFIVDSGAFYSTMSLASATDYGLKSVPAPFGFRMRGVNGDTSASIAVVKEFTIGGVAVPHVEFLVGGTDTGTVGLLGQNFLGIGDVEYDLPHGAIRLLRSEGCAVDGLAYWATDKPFTSIPLEPRKPPFQVHTVGTVTLNGVKLRAVFDTGAPTSILTLAAAKRAGVTPSSPETVSGSPSTGLGTRVVATWVGSFDKIEIGGEVIPKPKLLFGDLTLNDGDMLIGLDFFRTHRVYVANKGGRMLLTYEGGPVFGLVPRGARSADGTKFDLSDHAAEPTTAEGYSRRGAVFASNGKLDAALADFDHAVALAPAEAIYLRFRAAARLANKQQPFASADLDKAIDIDAKEPEARMMRGGIRLGAHNQAGALEDLLVADKMLPPSSQQRLQLGGMLTNADAYEAAVSNFDAWLKAHPEDAARPSALNGRCWARALLNHDLEKALEDCNAALRSSRGNPSFLDSRGLLRLRRGEFALALADYDAALRTAPKQAWSLYARSVVKKRIGDTSGAAADRAAAIAIEPEVVEQGKKIRIES